MKKAVAQMMQSLLLALAARSQLQELREKLRSPAVDKGPILKAKPPTTQKDILGVCCDPMVLAQQLTHIELVSAAVCVHSRHPEPQGPHVFLRIPSAVLPSPGRLGCQGRPASQPRPLALAGVCPPKQKVSLCLGSQEHSSPVLMGRDGVVRTKWPQHGRRAWEEVKDLEGESQFLP